MGIVWLIEKFKSKGALFETLAGNFAVRLFSSLKSFESLSRVKDIPSPDIILLGKGFDARQYSQWKDSCRKFPQSKHVCFEGVVANLTKKDSTYVIHEQSDRFDVQLCLLKLCESVGRTTHSISYKDIVLDMHQLEISMREDENESITLSVKEARLLKFMMDHPGDVLTRDDIMKAIWVGLKVSPRTIDCHVSRLRKKLSNTPVSIESRYGGGYVFS